MSSGDKNVELLQGTLDLIVLRSLSTMGSLHAYALASRLAQVSDHPLSLNQGTLYPALVRLDDQLGGLTPLVVVGPGRRDLEFVVAQVGRRDFGRAEVGRFRRNGRGRRDGRGGDGHIASSCHLLQRGRRAREARRGMRVAERGSRNARRDLIGRPGARLNLRPGGGGVNALSYPRYGGAARWRTNPETRTVR